MCLKCQTFYDDNGVKFCLNDGVPLLNIDRTHDLWEKGSKALRETQKTVTRQIRKQAIKTTVSTTVTTVLTVMVVSVVALNSYIYLNPEIKETSPETQPSPIVPMAMLPPTGPPPSGPDGEEPPETTPTETLPGEPGPETPDETNPPDPGTNTAVTGPGGSGGGVTPTGNTNPHNPGANTNVKTSGNTNPEGPGTNTDVKSPGNTNPCSHGPYTSGPAPMCTSGPLVLPPRNSNSNQREIETGDPANTNPPNRGPKKFPPEKKSPIKRGLPRPRADGTPPRGPVSMLDFYSPSLIEAPSRRPQNISRPGSLNFSRTLITFEMPTIRGPTIAEITKNEPELPCSMSDDREESANILDNFSDGWQAKAGSENRQAKADAKSKFLREHPGMAGRLSNFTIVRLKDGPNIKVEINSSCSASVKISTLWVVDLKNNFNEIISQDIARDNNFSCTKTKTAWACTY